MNNRLDVGSVLSRVFGIYGEQAGTLLPVAFGLFLVVGILQGVLGGAAALIAVIISLVATTIYQGMVVRLVEDVQDGSRDYTVGQLFNSVTPVLGPLIVAGIVAGIAIGIGFVLIIIPGLLLATIWAVFAPAIVVERAGAFQALGRSRELVKGHFGPVLGVIIVIFLIQAVVSLIGFALSGTVVAAVVARVILSTLTAPIGALAAGVLYFSLREAQGQGGPTAASGGPAEPGAAPPPPPAS